MNLSIKRIPTGIKSLYSTFNPASSSISRIPSSIVSPALKWPPTDISILFKLDTSLCPLFLYCKYTLLNLI